MTTNRDFKRLVRARMRKTGESYTSARSRLMRAPAASAATAPTASTAPADYARLAGISDAKLQANTACTWERWVLALDRVKAHTWSHGDIAAYVRKKYKVPMWWTQAVTVGYERIKGIRAIGQQRDGTYDAGKSRTFPVAVGRLYSAWADARTRRRWLGDAAITVRAAQKDRSLRITWTENTSVEVDFAGTGPGKSRVAVTHHTLPDKASVTRWKAYWAERLDALGKVLKV